VTAKNNKCGLSRKVARDDSRYQYSTLRGVCPTGWRPHSNFRIPDALRLFFFSAFRIPHSNFPMGSLFFGFKAKIDDSNHLMLISGGPVPYSQPEGIALIRLIELHI